MTSRRVLYLMGEPLGENVTRIFCGRMICGDGGGGGGGGGGGDGGDAGTGDAGSDAAAMGLEGGVTIGSGESDGSDAAAAAAMDAASAAALDASASTDADGSAAMAAAEAAAEAAGYSSGMSFSGFLNGAGKVATGAGKVAGLFSGNPAVMVSSAISLAQSANSAGLFSGVNISTGANPGGVFSSGAGYGDTSGTLYNTAIVQKKPLSQAVILNPDGTARIEYITPENLVSGAVGKDGANGANSTGQLTDGASGGVVNKIDWIPLVGLIISALALYSENK